MSRPSICPKIYVFILLAVFGLKGEKSLAQFNLKAGYNFSIMSDPGLNEVISTFNAGQPYQKGFKKIGWLHGFEAGVRLKSDIHALELSYQSAYQAHAADGQLLLDNTTYTDKINVAVNSFGAGYQLSGDPVGGGVEVQYQHYISKVRLAEQDEFREVQQMWGMKFYLMVTLEGSGYIDAAIQPYVVLPFSAFDPEPLSQYLNQEPGPAGKKWTRFGLSFIFYNGRK